jgi:hypothetical protein
MMMNIRGLVMDDPDNTSHLQTTIKFASSGSSNGTHRSVRLRAMNPGPSM